jgi:hypothetical protein
MKVGDLVRSVFDGEPLGSSPGKIGIVVDMIQKKCWRTNIQGKKVDWNSIDSEPHAVVSYVSNNGTLVAIPTVDLEVLSESG